MSEPVNGDGGSDPQVPVARVRVIDEPVDEPLGRVGAVGQLLDLGAQHPLGVVHQVVARRADRVDAVVLDELQEPLGADPRGGDLGLHVAHHERRGAHVVAQDPPHPLVAAPVLLDLDRVELQPLGVGVAGIDDAARAGRERAEVQVVGGCGRESDQLALVEHRDGERDVGAVGGAVVAVVVHHHVPGPPLLADLGEATVDAADVAGDRTGLQRRRLARLAQLARLGRRR